MGVWERCQEARRVSLGGIRQLSSRSFRRARLSSTDSRQSTAHTRALAGSHFPRNPRAPGGCGLKLSSRIERIKEIEVRTGLIQVRELTEAGRRMRRHFRCAELFA